MGRGVRSPGLAPPSLLGKGVGGLGSEDHPSPNPSPKWGGEQIPDSGRGRGSVRPRHRMAPPPAPPSGLTMSPTLGSSSGRSRPIGRSLAGLNLATALLAR